jgi:hypothetical protein
MENFNLSRLTAVIVVFLLFPFCKLNANVVVTPASGGSCANITPAAFSQLTNIVITEAAVGDFAVQSGTTFILSPPTGFEFKAGTGTVLFTAGQDITSASMVVTSSAITVTLNVGSISKMDVLRITLIQVRSLIPYSTGNITRPVAGGTATIAGDAPGGLVNHASLTTAGTGGAFITASNGQWSNAATWVGGIVPSCNDNVTILHNVTSDYAVGINNLTIATGGNLTSDNAVTVSGAFTMTGTGTYTHNNVATASSTIFKGTENFASTSSLIINRWFNFSIPFPTAVTGNFGNITFNTANSWSQNGLFAPARIQGTLTVNAGVLTMDDGNGATTALTLKDVLITGSARFIAQSGTARNLTLTTNNFTDNSSSTGYSYLMYLSVGNLNWTVNGNLNVSHRFTMVQGASAANTGSVTVNVSGNFSIGGGIFTGMQSATGAVSMTVAGTTSISGSPSSVVFKENYNGNVTFISGNMTVSSGLNNYFLRSNLSNGIVNVTINGDLNISGSTTNLYLASSTLSANDVNLTVTRDINLSDGQLTTASTPGDVTVSVGRNYTQTGATSVFYGQRQATGTAVTDIVVYGGLYISGGSFIQSSNIGTTTLNITEGLSVQNASFYGMNNASAGNNGISSLACTDLDINGSTFFLHRGEVTDGRTINVNITGQMTVNFTTSSQQVFFISRAVNNNARLNLTIGSNLFTTGTANGLFCTSMSMGAETVNITGDISIGAGRVRFNGYENSPARGHDLTSTVGGSVSISGGSLALSAHKGTTTWNIAGDYDQTGGYAVYKWHSGAATITVQGNYNLSGGNATLYSKTTGATTTPVNVIINGTAAFSSCNVMFDSCLTSSATHKITFKGSSVTYGDNVIFNHASHLTSRTIFGSLIFDRVGTINLNRNSASFDIRQVKQTITAGTTVNFASSPFDLMIASHLSNVAATHTTLSINGTLNMGTKMITGRNQSAYYASVDVNSGARIRTAHTNGFYSGTASNSCIYPLIGATYTMNYFLNAASTIEYNSTDTQIITGTGSGIATTVNHRYGNLEINFQGTPDVEFTYPATSLVFVRTSLILTSGELNLDSDHITATGGNILNILNGATITRTTGYIRSETEDGSGALRWNITSNGSYVIPFGYTSAEYIPFTFQPTSGSAGDVAIATYHTVSANTPFPPTVTHVRDVLGVDNSTSTVDRFWKIVVPGNSVADMRFSVTTAERSGITSPRAQLWEPVTQGWYPPSAVQSNPTANTTHAGGVSGFNNWWTLSSSANPLPVEMVSFDAIPQKENVKLEWITSSEVNNDYFNVQRSSDGVDFISILRVEGAGTSSSMHSYQQFDSSPLRGINYYRIMQTDFDGKTSFSEVRTVNFKQITPVLIYPNPVAGNFINISTGDESTYVERISLYDLAGKLIMSDKLNNNEFKAAATLIDLKNNLAEGTYMLEIGTNTGTFRERIIKQ